MKKTLNFLAVITLFSFVLAACAGQSGRKDTKIDMSEMTEGMQEVIQTIDEAIASNDISEFKNKTDDAVGSLDKQIDDYLNEMDKAEQRIQKNAQDLVIEMKQKNVEVELKLALLEQDDVSSRESGMNGSPSDDARDVPGTIEEGVNPLVSSEMARDDDDLNRGTDTDRAEMYGAPMVDDIKEDLRELKRDVEQFMQASLSYSDNN